MKRRKLDFELVRRGFADNQTEAQLLISKNRVLVSGSLASNPSRMVEAGEPVHVQDAPLPYVSRGGLKLEAALERFQIAASNKDVLDVGASTGGFTDCLLQHGATSVTAVDVGRAQLHQRLRLDPRVKNLERTNIKTATDIGGPFSLITVDVSFISVRTIAHTLTQLGTESSDIVVLIKPQFEASRAEVSLGRGVIVDPNVWRRSIEGVVSAMHACGAATMGLMVSPIHGSEGNVEFLAYMKNHCQGPDIDVEAVVNEAERS